MSWKVTRVNTWWSAEEACTVLSFLDELRDQLWESYGEQITAMRLEELDARENQNNQGRLDLDDCDDF